MPAPKRALHQGVLPLVSFQLHPAKALPSSVLLEHTIASPLSSPYQVICTDPTFAKAKCLLLKLRAPFEGPGPALGPTSLTQWGHPEDQQMISGS